MDTLLAFALLALAAGCSPAGEETETAAIPAGNQAAPAPVGPPAPGEPGGLDDDRTPVSEAPFAETSAQGAAQVVQTYFGLLEQRRFGEASRLRADGTSEAALAARFAPFNEVHAEVGAPGRIEGAAGSLYVEVPVVAYGRLADGAPFSRRAAMTLRRSNDVPGATAEQRRWRIVASSLEPEP